MAGNGASSRLRLLAGALLLSTALGGCIDSGPSGATEPLLVPHDEDTEFVVPSPRIGDVAIYESTYIERSDGDVTLEFRGTQRYTVVDLGRHEDGYGVPHDVFETNLTSLDNGTEAYWETYWVDIASNGQIAARYGPDPSFGRFHTDYNGLAQSDAQYNGTSFSTSYEAGNWLKDHGILGGFVQGRVLPKEGSWERFHAGYNVTLNFTLAWSEGIAKNCARPCGSPYEWMSSRLSVETETPDGSFLAVSAVASSSLPYVKAAERLIREGDFEIEYSVRLLNYTAGGLFVNPGTDDLVLSPSSTPSGELTDTFPAGGATFLAYTPDQAKQAAVLGDRDIANWFTAHPDAFLSFGAYYTGTMEEAVGVLHGLLTEEQRELVRFIGWYTDFTDPATGETLGFQTAAFVTGSSTLPPVYLRHEPWSGAPTEPNLYSSQKDAWLEDRTGIASLSDVLETFQATAGPYADRAPNLLLFITFPGGGHYILAREEQFATRDSVFGVAGWAPAIEVHHVVVDLDGRLAHVRTSGVEWSEDPPF